MVMVRVRIRIRVRVRVRVRVMVMVRVRVRVSRVVRLAAAARERCDGCGERGGPLQLDVPRARR